MGEVQTIAVDGQTFAVRFRGWHVALDVVQPAGSLAPWRLGDHAEALRARRDLDGDGFADAVLARCWTGEAPGPRPLALWWAAGADPSEGRVVEHGLEVEIPLGPDRVSLRPWTLASRIGALRAAGALDEPPRLDLGLWLLARVEGHLRARPDMPVEALPTAPLLAALRALETPADGVDLAILPPRLRAWIGRACQALGCTPAEVLAAPAVEIDRLMSLIEQPAPAAPAAPPQIQGLAAKAGAVVFQFEPDEEEA